MLNAVTIKLLRESIRHLLVEASKDRYLQMFDFNDDAIKNHRDEILSHIEWAKQVLKKSDRIVWFLKYVRLYYYTIASFETPEPNLTKIKKLELKMKTPLPLRDNEVFFISSSGWKEVIEHFFSLGLPAINDLEWGQKSWREIRKYFEKVEDEWQSRLDGLIPIEGDEEILIDFGDGFYWIDLERQSCSIESRAMGHCGNAGSHNSDDTVLSLREKTKLEDGTPAWRPCLTFILDTSNGLLGEMKGRKNSKPKPEYHKYIISLLKLDIVKGIVGGGYKPQNNFSLKDLPPEVYEKLINEKIELAPIKVQYEKTGMTEALLKRMKNMLKYSSDDFPAYQNGEFIIGLWKDLQSFIDELDSSKFDTVKWLLKVITMEENLDVWHDPDSYILKDIYDGLSPETKSKIDARLGDGITWNEDEDIIRALTQGYWTGVESGMLDDAYKQFYSFIDEIGLKSDNMIENKIVPFDTPCYLPILEYDLVDIFSDPDHVDTIEQNGWFEGFIEWRELKDIHSNGIDGYNHEAAIEQANEALYDVLE